MSETHEYKQLHATYDSQHGDGLPRMWMQRLRLSAAEGWRVLQVFKAPDSFGNGITFLLVRKKGCTPDYAAMATVLQEMSDDAYAEAREMRFMGPSWFEEKDAAEAKFLDRKAKAQAYAHSVFLAAEAALSQLDYHPARDCARVCGGM